MAAASSTYSPTLASVAVTLSRPKLKPNKVVYLTGINSYEGVRAQNNGVCTLGRPLSVDQCFDKVIRAMQNRSSTKKWGGGGGALSATCSPVGEIFKIAAIMNAITLVGVAIGFVLLRIEASVEEAE